MLSRNLINHNIESNYKPIEESSRSKVQNDAKQ